MGWYWGTIMVIIGAYLVIAAANQSERIPYRWLAARSRLLWKSHPHSFLLSSGVVMVILGLLWAAGIIWS